MVHLVRKPLTSDAGLPVIVHAVADDPTLTVDETVSLETGYEGDDTLTGTTDADEITWRWWR